MVRENSLLEKLLTEKQSAVPIGLQKTTFNKRLLQEII